MSEKIIPPPPPPPLLANVLNHRHSSIANESVVVCFSHIKTTGRKGDIGFADHQKKKKKKCCLAVLCQRQRVLSRCTNHWNSPTFTWRVRTRQRTATLRLCFATMQKMLYRKQRVPTRNTPFNQRMPSIERSTMEWQLRTSTLANYWSDKGIKSSRKRSSRKPRNGGKRKVVVLKASVR